MYRYVTERRTERWPPRGDGKNNEVQPHAITHAPSATMRGENPQRDALPVPGDQILGINSHEGI